MPSLLVEKKAEETAVRKEGTAPVRGQAAPHEEGPAPQPRRRGAVGDRPALLVNCDVCGSTHPPGSDSNPGCPDL